MIRTRKRMGLCTALLVLNLMFIWGNSLMPGEISKAFSHWVQAVLDALLGGTPGPSEEGHGLLRKLAHFTEFCCLGLCLTWLGGMLKKKPWLPLLCGFLAACTDELIQCFVPERGPGFKDVLIDTAGVSLGIVVLLLGHKLSRKRKQRKNLEESKQ